MCGVCPVTGVQCGFFLVLTDAHDETEWQQVIPAGRSILPRKHNSTDVGSPQGNWHHFQLAAVHILCVPR